MIHNHNIRTVTALQSNVYVLEETQAAISYVFQSNRRLRFYVEVELAHLTYDMLYSYYL